jgi:peptidyl-prolyl cis-trans isomerase D
MLKFLGKRKRSSKLLLLVFIGLLVLGLVGFFGPSWTSLSGATADDRVVARVGKYDITLKEFRSQLTSFGQQMAMGQGQARRESPERVYSIYGKQILDNLIRQKLIIHAAEQANIQTTDREVQDQLKRMFNPWPGADQYRAQLKQAGVTPVEFEDSIRASIAEQKLRSLVTAGLMVSPQEIEEDYRRTNTNYNLRWVQVTASSLRDKVQFTDADLQAFFNQRKSEFYINDEQRRARYIFIDQTRAGENLQVSDDELKQEFNPERNIRDVRVSQIVFNIPKEAPKKDAAKGATPADTASTTSSDSSETGEEKARKKAEEAANLARGADSKPAEDFATLARERSEDAATKANGGDLGWVNKDTKRDSDDPLNRVFTMQKDEVSQPIKKGDKYYVLKVTDRRLPTFEESRAQLIKEARVRKGYTKAAEIATEAEQKFKESKNADAVVAEINAKYGANAAAVKETPFFAEDDSVPELGASSDFQTKLFDLDNIGDIGNYTNVSSGFAIPQYTEKRDPHEPTFEEVKTKIEDSYRTEKSKDLAAERARQLAQATTPDALRAAAASLGIKVDERQGVNGTDSIGPLVSEAERASIYKLNINQVTSTPIKNGDGENYVVASLLGRVDADMGQKFQEQRKSIEDRLLDAKRNMIFMSYLSSVQKQMKDKGDIEVYQQVIDESLGGAAAAAGFDPTMGLPPPGTSSRPRRSPPGS